MKKLISNWTITPTQNLEDKLLNYVNTLHEFDTPQGKQPLSKLGLTFDDRDFLFEQGVTDITQCQVTMTKRNDYLYYCSINDLSKDGREIALMMFCTE